MLQPEPATYIIMLSSIINFAFSAILVIFLTVNFFRKKTVGTAMLLSSYFLFSAASAMSIAYNIMYILTEEIGEVVYFIATLGPLILLPAYGFLYIFACRHILRDSEITRVFVFGTIMVLYGLATSLVGYNNLIEAGIVGFPSITRVTFVTYGIFTITYITFIWIAQIVIATYVAGRIGFRALRLAKKSDQIVRKRGLQIIGIGVLFYFLGGLLSSFDSIITEIPVLMIVVAFLRALVFAASYVMLYLGWIMPAWFRRMIRKRSWFEIQYKNSMKS